VTSATSSAPASHAATLASVDDARTGRRFELEVERERALHAFHHPYAYHA
jgi:hypothetical protein